MVTWRRLPDLWSRLTNAYVHVKDEDWRVPEIAASLCNRRRDERAVAYVESHDQCIVGEQTLGALQSCRAAIQAGAVLYVWLQSALHTRAKPVG